MIEKSPKNASDSKEKRNAQTPKVGRVLYISLVELIRCGY